ncbi:MAG TPA: SDR family oxidoreductase [Nevskiaceae bacterium]|nr:SDR family oxidoreductase [Nevskiaceae bacterium]
MIPYGTALVTGASGGIGEAFARRLAAEGLDLLLVARSKGKLERLARELRKSCGIRAEVFAADLAQPDPGILLRDAADGFELPVDLLVNNAGFGNSGHFHKLEAAREQEMIAVNIAALVDITHAFLPRMLSAKRGGIVNIASLTAFQPTPFMSAYGASKAFVLSFSEGLWGEYRDQGIRVLAVCPGPVDTGFFEASGKPETRAMSRRLMLKPKRVVDDAIDALEKNRSLCVPGGLGQSVIAGLPRVAPRRWVAARLADVFGQSVQPTKRKT